MLQKLAEAGSSMEYNQFRRLLNLYYSTDNAQKCAIKELYRLGYVQRHIVLTATGSAKAQAAMNDRELLEAAAKAAGLPLKSDDAYPFPTRVPLNWNHGKDLK